MRIVIAGAGEVGTHLAKMLSNEEQDIIVIDKDEKKLYNLGLGLGNVASDVGAPIETAYRLTPSDIGLMLKGDSGTFDQKIENFKQSEWYKKLPEQKKNIIEEAFKKAAKKRKE